MSSVSKAYLFLIINKPLYVFYTLYGRSGAYAEANPGHIGTMTAASNAPDMPFVVIYVPSQVSCIDARDTDRGLIILVGTEDGTIRRYTSPSYKVTKALRGLSKGVSWVQFSAVKNEEDCFWISSGMEV